MGYVIDPNEVRNWMWKMRMQLDKCDMRYQAALTLIMEFAENEELVGYTYNTMKDQMGVCYQLAVHGAEQAREATKKDLDILAGIIGAEVLDEDVLRDQIDRLKEECRRYEDKIEELKALSRMPFISYFLEESIRQNRSLLNQTKEIIRQLEEKIRKIYEIDARTAGLFVSASGWYAAIRQILNDLQVSITGTGTMSSGSLKAILADSYKEEHGNLWGVGALYDKYLTIEMFKEINDRWDVDKAAQLCGYESPEKFFEALRFYMMDANITNEVSICMFLAYLGVESAYGTKMMEARTDFSNVSYTFNTRGGGLSQLTSATQKDYIKYLAETLPEGELKKRAKELLAGYSQEGNQNSVGDVAEFIGKNFPVESAVWFWAEYKKAVYFEGLEVYEYKNEGDEKRWKTKNVTLNDYVILLQNYNLDNVYLAIQCYVNGSAANVEQRQRIGMTEETYEVENGIIQYSYEGEIRVLRVPNGWGERKADWDRLKENMGKFKMSDQPESENKK